MEFQSPQDRNSDTMMEETIINKHAVNALCMPQDSVAVLPYEGPAKKYITTASPTPHCLIPRDSTAAVLYEERTQNTKKTELLPICLINNGAEIEKIVVSDRESKCDSTRSEKYAANYHSNDAGMIFENVESTLRGSNLSLAKNHGKEIKKSNSLKDLKNRLLTREKRSNSLPLLSSLLITNHFAQDQINHMPDTADISMPYDVVSFVAETPVRAAATPPPSYKSLVKQNLEDIPPLYQIVTGKTINLGPESPKDNLKRNNSGCSRIHRIPRSSRIFILIIIVTLLIVTIILVLTETLNRK